MAGTGTAGCGLAPGWNQGEERAGACCQLAAAAAAAEACVCSNYEGIMLNPQSLLHGHAGTLKLKLKLMLMMTTTLLLPTRRG